MPESKLAQFRAAYAKFAKAHEEHSIAAIMEQAVYLRSLQSGPPRGFSGLNTEQLEQALQVAESEKRKTEEQGRLIDIVGPILIEVATEMRDTARYIQERAALEDDITMQDKGKRLVNLLRQLAGCYGDKSPLIAAKKTILQKDIGDFIKEIEAIFELPMPTHKIG